MGAAVSGCFKQHTIYNRYRQVTISPKGCLLVPGLLAFHFYKTGMCCKIFRFGIPVSIFSNKIPFCLFLALHYLLQQPKRLNPATNKQNLVRLNRYKETIKRHKETIKRHKETIKRHKETIKPYENQVIVINKPALLI